MGFLFYLFYFVERRKLTLTQAAIDTNILKIFDSGKKKTTTSSRLTGMTVSVNAWRQPFGGLD